MLEAHKKSKELDSTFKELTKEIQSISKEKVASEKQRKSALKKHAQLELDTQDLEEKISGGDRAKVDAEKQLKNLQKEIQDSETELNEARPEYNKKLGVEEKIKKRIMEYEKELSILYQKQGRTTQFASKTDLDKWLQKEIDDYQRVLSANQLQVAAEDADFYCWFVQKQFSELLMKAASDYGALTASVADVQWSQNFVTTYSMGDVAGMDKAAHQLQLTLEESNT